MLATGGNASEWAKGEISTGLNLLPDSAFENDLTRPTTCSEFAEFSVHFLAAQYNMDIHDFRNIIWCKMNRRKNNAK